MLGIDGGIIISCFRAGCGGIAAHASWRGMVREGAEVVDGRSAGGGFEIARSRGAFEGLADGRQETLYAGRLADSKEVACLVRFALKFWLYFDSCFYLLGLSFGQAKPQAQARVSIGL